MGFVGSAITLLLPLMEVLITIFQVIAGAGGLVLLFLSIRHKLIQIKNDKK